MKNSKKNIVYILSDQHNYQVMSCSGHPIVETPNIDWLATNGVRFENCYCASPLCVPSRTSILSGKYPHKTQIFTNNQALKSDEATFVHSLGAANYETVLCGRMHFIGPDQRHGFEKRLVGDLTEVYPNDIGDQVLGELSGTTSQAIEALEKAGPGFSSIIEFDKAVCKEACDYIEERMDSRPIFMTIGFYGPHCPFVCPDSLFDYYYDKLSEAYIDGKEKVESEHPAITKWKKERGIRTVTEEQSKRIKAAYYGLVNLLDEYIGKIIEACDKRWGIENTVLVYSSDHGEMLGEKGMYWKSNGYEGAVKVPLIMMLPELEEKGSIINTPVSLLDLAPTFIELVGGPRLPNLDGENLFKLNSNRFVMSQYGGKGEKEYPIIIARRREYKLISYYGYADEELYNVDNDPDEKMNLVDKIEYDNIRKELKAAIEKVWNGKNVIDAIEKHKKHLSIIKKWAKTTHVESIEHWPIKKETNFIRKDFFNENKRNN